MLELVVLPAVKRRSLKILVFVRGALARSKTFSSFLILILIIIAGSRLVFTIFVVLALIFFVFVFVFVVVILFPIITFNVAQTIKL